MDIIPNLHFSGDCEAAIRLYERAFKGRVTVLIKHSEADPGDLDGALSSKQKAYVYHAEMIIGGQRVLMNDHTDDIPHGLNVSLLVSFDSVEEVQEAYEILKDGATIISPIQETSYSSCFVSLVDRHGVRWELMKEN